jgi:hypothetical protein
MGDGVEQDVEDDDEEERGERAALLHPPLDGDTQGLIVGEDGGDLHIR